MKSSFATIANGLHTVWGCVQETTQGRREDFLQGVPMVEFSWGSKKDFLGRGQKL